MGNYYAGMMNATGGSELRHFGILGQKWGVRRFQNKDGSLTPAGRERYGYSDRDRKELDKALDSALKTNSADNLKKTTAYKDGVNKQEKFGLQRRDKRQEIYESVVYVDADKIARSNIPSDVRDKSSSEVENEYKKYRNLSGTKSLFGGDHSKDEGVKVRTEYQDEIDKNRDYILNSKDKDEIKEKVANVANKYIDKYAKAVLKDMKYDVSPESIAWLKKQPWFYLDGADDVLF